MKPKSQQSTFHEQSERAKGDASFSDRFGEETNFASRGRRQPFLLAAAEIQDDFWSDYIRLVREVVVPYQWEVLNDRVPGAAPSGAIRNYRIAAGDEEGEFYGMVFQDSDVAKWLEAVGYLLGTAPDSELERAADEVIDIVARAQQPDGYLNTYFTVKEPAGRWTNLAECHELYCAGHLIEAAVAYYNATGKNRLLDVVCRYADYIGTVFGTEPGKLQGYDGHQEIELALVKLYHATGEERYLKLSQYFLDQRGAQPHFYEKELQQRGGTVHFPEISVTRDYAYSQAHLPVREQAAAEGHAVRVVYMCAGMADVAAETSDAKLLEACAKLWRNIVSKRMYITGGIGSMAHGESFTLDYDLPGDTAYAETCASIGLIFFARRMLRLEPKSEYADVLERALYNTVLSGMSQDGKRFFYVNPLEVYPHAHGKNRLYDHVMPERQGWFGCACCPPNIARLLASLGQYIYGTQDRTLYTHLYIGSRLKWQLDDQHVLIEQNSRYTQEGTVSFRVVPESPVSFRLALRIPDWCGEAACLVNGIPLELDELVEDGYAVINRLWEAGDTVDLTFSMPVLRMKGHPHIRQTAGKTAIQRGPFVYCLEEADNGPDLHQIVLPEGSRLEASPEAQPAGGIPHITGQALRRGGDEWNGALYRSGVSGQSKPVEVTFIPYYTWANRGAGEMAVWIRD